MMRRKRLPLQAQCAYAHAALIVSEHPIPFPVHTARLSGAESSCFSRGLRSQVTKSSVVPASLPYNRSQSAALILRSNVRGRSIPVCGSFCLQKSHNEISACQHLHGFFNVSFSQFAGSLGPIKKQLKPCSNVQRLVLKPPYNSHKLIYGDTMI